METSAQVTEAKETTADEEDLELDLENSHVQQVMQANSIQTQLLVLANGTTIELNRPWTREDGTTPAYPLLDKETQKPAVDEKGKPRFLLVGAIFFIEESTTTVHGDDDEIVSTRIPAHYEVWTEPGAMMRRQRIFLEQVVYSEEAVPMGWAADQVMTDRLPDQLVIDTKEVIEAAKKLEETNGQASG